MTNPYYARILYGIGEAARKYGFSTFYSTPAAVYDSLATCPTGSAGTMRAEPSYWKSFLKAIG